MGSYSFDVSQADVLALTSAYYRASPTVRASIRLVQLLYVSLTLIVAAVAAGHYGHVDYAVFYLLAMVVVVPLLPRWIRASMRKSASKVLQESSYERAYGRQSLSLTDEALISTNALGECKYLWAGVDRYSVTPDYLFIFLAGPQGLVVPRAELPPEQFRQIEAFVEARLPNAG